MGDWLTITRSYSCMLRVNASMHQPYRQPYRQDFDYVNIRMRSSRYIMASHHHIGYVVGAPFSSAHYGYCAVCHDMCSFLLKGHNHFFLSHALYRPWSVLYTCLYTLYSVCTLYFVLCLCTLYSVSVLCALYSVLCTLYSVLVLCALYSVLCTLYSVLCALCSQTATVIESAETSLFPSSPSLGVPDACAYEPLRARIDPAAATSGLLSRECSFDVWLVRYSNIVISPRTPAGAWWSGGGVYSGQTESAICSNDQL
jgi:hypothetical protein